MKNKASRLTTKPTPSIAGESAPAHNEKVARKPIYASEKPKLTLVTRIDNLGLLEVLICFVGIALILAVSVAANSGKKTPTHKEIDQSMTPISGAIGRSEDRIYPAPHNTEK